MWRYLFAMMLLLGIIHVQAATLEVVPSAKYAGEYGLHISLDGEAACFVEDGSPISEARYRARFYIRINTIELADDESISLLTAKDSSNVTHVHISLVRLNGVYRIRTTTRLETGQLVETGELDSPVIESGWHCIEIDWQAASTSGYAAIWYDGTPQLGLTNLANVSARIDMVRFGVPDGIPATASGDLSLDLFESRRESYIGLSCYTPQEFSAFFSIWHPDYTVADLVQQYNAQCP